MVTCGTVDPSSSGFVSLAWPLRIVYCSWSENTSMFEAVHENLNMNDRPLTNSWKLSIMKNTPHMVYTVLINTVRPWLSKSWYIWPVVVTVLLEYFVNGCMYFVTSVCSIRVVLYGLHLTEQIHLSEHFCDSAGTKVFG